MREANTKIVDELNAIFEKMLTYYVETEDGLKHDVINANLQELADDLHAVREMQDMIDELRRRTNKRREWLEKCICAQFVKVSTTGEPIRTDYCTASPDIGMAASMPKHGTPEYKLFMRFFNIPDDITDGGALKPHWPSMVEHLTGLLADGLPIPPGIDIKKLYPIYKVRLTNRKPLVSFKKDG